MLGNRPREANFCEFKFLRFLFFFLRSISRFSKTDFSDKRKSKTTSIKVHVVLKCDTEMFQFSMNGYRMQGTVPSYIPIERF